MRVVVLVGLPGSGKSTWAGEQAGAVLSSDAIRQLLADDATDQSIHREVFATLRYLLRRRLQFGRAVTYVDATNLTTKDRQAYIHLGHFYGARVEALYFATDLEECKRRNHSRPRVVPDEAIDWMASRTVLPSLAEGFDSVTFHYATSAGPTARPEQGAVEPSL